MMENSFQAKDIQKILEIPKYRYEYIATKIGIWPEIDEADGQGQMHRYSFKNVLQFAFAHYASNLGLTPRSVREMLNYLDKLGQIETVRLGIYDPHNFEILSLHHVIDGNSRILCATYTAGKAEEPGRIVLDGVDEGFPYPSEKDALELYLSLGFVTINITEIKRSVVKKIGS